MDRDTERGGGDPEKMTVTVLKSKARDTLELLPVLSGQE